MLEVGTKAPDFELADKNGEMVRQMIRKQEEQMSGQQ